MIEARQRRLVFLVGARGSGKTTVGRLFAERRGWQFVDADDMLEAVAGTTIAQIFATAGEMEFRLHEAALLDRLAKRTDCVVATGGGVVLAASNRRTLRAKGYCVWLSADAATLWARIVADPATAARRPALTNLAGPEEVARLLHEREPLYREVAHLIVDAAQSPDDAVSAILSACSIS